MDVCELQSSFGPKLTLTLNHKSRYTLVTNFLHLPRLGQEIAESKLDDSIIIVPDFFLYLYPHACRAIFSGDSIGRNHKEMRDKDMTYSNMRDRDMDAEEKRRMYKLMIQRYCIVMSFGESVCIKETETCRWEASVLPTDFTQTQATYKVSCLGKDGWAQMSINAHPSNLPDFALTEELRHDFIIGDATSPLLLQRWRLHSAVSSAFVWPESHAYMSWIAANTVRAGIVHAVTENVKVALSRNTAVLIIADEPITALLTVAESLCRHLNTLPAKIAAPLVYSGPPMSQVFKALDANTLQATEGGLGSVWRKDDPVGAHQYMMYEGSGRLVHIHNLADGRVPMLLCPLLPASQLRQAVLAKANSQSEPAEQDDAEVMDAGTCAFSVGEGKCVRRDDMGVLVRWILQGEKRGRKLSLIDLRDYASNMMGRDDCTPFASALQGLVDVVSFELPSRYAWTASPTLTVAGMIQRVHDTPTNRERRADTNGASGNNGATRNKEAREGRERHACRDGCVSVACESLSLCTDVLVSGDKVHIGLIKTESSEGLLFNDLGRTIFTLNPQEGPTRETIDVHDIPTLFRAPDTQQ